MRRWLWAAIAFYLLIGLAHGVWVQVRADPNDPPPMPIWAPGLSFGHRLGAVLWMVPVVLLWPIFLLPTIYWCLIQRGCG